MSQAIMRKRSTSTSLREKQDARTVLLRMAHDEARAQRIRALKKRYPDVRWHEIADYVGVKERSAIAWQQTGGISRANVKKLAEFFTKVLGATDVTAEWIWRGDNEVPDLMSTLNGDEGGQLDRIEKMLREILTRVSRLESDAQELLGRGHEQELDEEAGLGDLPSDAAEEDEDEPGAQAG